MACAPSTILPTCVGEDEEERRAAEWVWNRRKYPSISERPRKGFAARIEEKP
jgi:hypothetical protein